MTLAADDVRRLVQVVSRLSRLLNHCDIGISLQQYRILGIVDAGDERSSRLAANLAVTKPTITAAVDGLVAAGHLTRTVDAQDRRAVRLQLSRTGRAALRAADNALRTRLAPMFGELSDPASLARVLDELDAGVDAVRRARGADCAPGGRPQNLGHASDSRGPVSAPR